MEVVMIEKAEDVGDRYEKSDGSLMITLKSRELTTDDIFAQPKRKYYLMQPVLLQSNICTG
jgi:hypothetical protein